MKLLESIKSMFVKTEYLDSENSLSKFQKGALETATYPKNVAILYTTLGLAGEAGEVANKVKKVIRDNKGKFTPELKLKIADEVGDVLWYAATLSHELGFNLEEIARMNKKKLDDRAKRGTISGSGDVR